MHGFAGVELGPGLARLDLVRHAHLHKHLLPFIVGRSHRVDEQVDASLKRTAKVNRIFVSSLDDYEFDTDRFVSCGGTGRYTSAPHRKVNRILFERQTAEVLTTRTSVLLSSFHL